MLKNIVKKSSFSCTEEIGKRQTRWPYNLDIGNNVGKILFKVQEEKKQTIDELILFAFLSATIWEF